MSPIRLTLFALLPLCSSALRAQTVMADTETWNESHVNAPANIQYGGSNPVSIAYNEVKKYGVARVNYNYASGDFHRPDCPGKDRQLGVYIGGLQNVKKFDLAGSFSYNNAQRGDMRWNSTLGLNPYNPFILADSVMADRTVETFDLHANGVYSISERWKAGLQIAFTSSRLSDQTDPRPETSMSRFPITVGAEYTLSERMRLGLALNGSFYRSDIDYTLINPLNYYQYFLMKGNGDYYRRSSADVSGYEREYKGTTYGGALQMTNLISDQSTNYLEVGYSLGNEDAVDQGNMPFRGGDYSYGKMTLSDRFQWQCNRTRHNVILSMQYATGEGTWYDQKRKVDTEHGNRQYYDILSKYKVYSHTNIGAQLGYSLATHNTQGQRDLLVDATVGMRNDENKHIDVQPTMQKGTLLDVQAAVGKFFPIGKAGLDAILRGGYQMPLSTSFADASTLLGENLSASYTAPMFQYTYAQAFHVGAQLDAHMPASQNITCGITLTANYQRCLDDCKWAKSYESTQRTYVDAGIYMKF